MHPVFSLDLLVARELPGTEGGFLIPFWSADSRFVTYIAGDKLRKIDITGGSPQTVCNASSLASLWGGSWNRDGIILLSGADGLYRVSASGGAIRVTLLESARQELSHEFPQFLPDGRHFIYLARSKRSENNAIYAGLLDSKDTVRLLTADSKTMHTLPGYLVFAREGALMAQHFDAATLQLRDEPVRIAEQILAWQEIAAFSMSENGVLAYREGDISRQRFQWRDRAGKTSADMGEARSYVNFDLSPDASRIVAAGPPGGLYLIDGPRNVTSVLSVPDPSSVDDPIWSSDGRFIVFDWSIRRQIVRIPANGGSETILYEGDPKYKGPYSEDWSNVSPSMFAWVYCSLCDTEKESGMVREADR